MSKQDNDHGRFKRFGIYFTPGTPDLAEAGAAWLGWDLQCGKSVPPPWPDLTARPRKYGFHATIKPPCRLNDGQTLAAVDEALANLCTRVAPVPLDALKIDRIGSFLALTPEGGSDALDAMAAQVVREMDGFRAQPSTDELQKRRRPSMNAAQLANIENWGYPFVMESFRFHMTLTGPQKPDVLTEAAARAERHFAHLLPAPFIIDGLTLVGEGQDDLFYQISRHTFAGGPK